MRKSVAVWRKLGGKGGQFSAKATVAAVLTVLATVLPFFGINALASGPSSNRILNYQIRLTSSTGVPVADGSLNLKLTFYDSSTDGTQLYTACSSDGSPTGTPAAVSATFSNGSSSVLIGDTAVTCATGTAVAMPGTIFSNAAIYLGVTASTDAEMTPRKRIVAAGYALNADRLDDLETSSSGGANAFVPVTDASGNFTLTKDVTFDTSTFFLQASTDRIGMGTTSPAAKLELRPGTGLALYAAPAYASLTALAQGYVDGSVSAVGTLNEETGRVAGLFAMNQSNVTAQGSVGLQAYAEATNASGTKAFSQAVSADAYANGAGTVTDLDSIAAYGSVRGGGTVTNMRGLHVYAPDSNGTVDSYYGIHLESPSGVAATNSWQIYADGASPFVVKGSGDVGVGTASPAARLDVAGTVRLGAASTDSVSVLGMMRLSGFANSEAGGTNGQIYYNSTSNKFRCYQNSVWTDCVTAAGGTMSSFTLAGSSGPSQTITDGNTLTIAQGNGIASVASTTDTVTLSLGNLTGAWNQTGVFAITHAGNLTVNGTTTLGDATGDTVVFNGYIGSNLIPTVDNTYDLGSTTNRWKTLHVGPGSVVVHNDATNTAKATLGFSGATAQLVTDSTTPFKLTVGTNDGLNMNTTGDVGIGTTAGAGNRFLVKATATGVNIIGAMSSASANLLGFFYEDALNNGQLYLRNSSNVNAISLHTSGTSFLNGGNVAIGTTAAGSLLTVGSTGQFTVNSSGVVSTSGTISSTSTGTNALSGALTVAGNTTLGDASTDTLTVNGTAVSVPNGLNFDSNTLYIDSSNDRIGIGDATPSDSLSVVGASATVSLAPGDLSRRYQMQFDDPSGAFSFTRSDTTGKLYVVPDATTVRVIASGVSIAKLAISGPGTNGQLYLNTGEGGTGGNVVFGKRASDDLILPTTYQFFGGNVGVGTASPAASVDVFGPVRLGAASTDAVTVRGMLGLSGFADSELGGTNGQTYYNSTLNKFRCYQNSAWTDCIAAGSVTGSGAQYQIAFWSSASGLVGSGPGTSGQLLISQGAGAYPSLNAMSGDATISNTGALTLATVNPNVGAYGAAGQATVVTVNGKGLVTAVSTTDIAIAAGQVTSGTLAVARGGTGTSTAFTAGSVVFAGASGTYGQDNANFFWDATSSRLGLGTTTPNEKLEVVGNVRVSSGYKIGALSAFYQSGSDILVNNSASLKIRLTQAGTDRLMVDTTGYVGIGSSSPSARLDVAGTVKLGAASTDAVSVLGMLGLTGFANSEAGGTNGQIYYNSTLNKFRCYENSAWKDCDTNAGMSVGGTVTSGTAGSMLYVGAGPVLAQTATTDLVWDSVNKRLGLGTAAPAFQLHSYKTSTATSGSSINVQGETWADAASASTGNYRGGRFQAQTIASTTDYSSAILYGLMGQSMYNGTVTLGTGIGGGFNSYNNSTGTISSAQGISSSVANVTTGTITAAIAYAADVSNVGGGTIGTYTAFATPNASSSATTVYGFRGLNSAAANKWNLYADGTAQNYFAGNVGIGSAVPSAKLDVAGTVRLGAASTDAVTVLGMLGLSGFANSEAGGTNGQMYYNASTDKFRCRQNSAWTDCITAAGGTMSSWTLAGTSGSNSTITNGNTATIAAGTNISTTGNGSGTVTVGLTGTVAATNGGTGNSSYATGDTLYSNTPTTLAKLAIGSNGQMMMVGSGLPSWSTATWPATVTSGNLLYASGTNAVSGLANGSSGYVLTSTGSAPQWSQYVAAANGGTGINTSASTGVPSISSGTWSVNAQLPVSLGGTGATAFTQGSIVFAGASGVYSQDNANFFWDDTNNRLGIGTTSPSGGFQVRQASTSDTLIPMWVTRTTSGGDYLTLADFGSGGNGGWRINQNSGGLNALSTWTVWDSSDDRWEAQATTSVGATLVTMNTNGGIYFNTQPSAAVTVGDPLSFNNTLTLLGNGNVGVGNAAPASLLSVGSTSQFQVNSSGAVAAATGITSSGTITFSGFSSNGGPLYTNGSGVLAQATAGTATQVLHGGTTPSFGAVSLTADVTGTLPVGNGGTSFSSYATGDLLVGGASAGLTKLAAGTSGYALLSNGANTAPSWGQLSLTSGVTGTLPVGNGGTGTSTTFTQGSAVFAGASGVYSQDNANFFWDDSNNRLGIGTATPSYSLSVGTSGFANYQSGAGTNDSLKVVSSNIGANFATQNTNASGFSGVEYINNAGTVQVFTGFNNSNNQEFRFNNIASGGYIDFMLGSASKMRIASGGNVGIGTTTVGSLLTVGSAGQFTVDSSGNVATTGNATLGDASTDSLTVNAMMRLVAVANSELGGTNGQMYYNSTLNKFRCYQNSAWTDCVTAAGGTMSSFTLAGSSGANQTISDGNTLTIAQGSGIATVGGATDTVTVSLGNLTGAWNQTGVFGITHAGDLTVNGSTTVGDASTDTLTVNSKTVSIPNSLNFDANTLYIDSSNDRVAIGTTTASALLTVGSTGQFTVTSVGAVTIPANTALNLSGGTGAGSISHNGTAFSFGSRATTAEYWQSSSAGAGVYLSNATGYIESAGPSKLSSDVADGATAVGAILTTSTTLANASAKLLSIRNNNVEKAYVDTTGMFVSAVASGNSAFMMQDGARLSFSTTDASSYLYRSAANVIRTPGALTVDGNATLGDASTDLVNLTGMAQLTGFANSEAGGTNGQIYYNSTNNKFRCYQNSAWTDCVTAAGGTMSSFTLAGSSGANQTITDGNTLTVAQGNGIATVGGATDTVTVSLGNLTGAWSQTGNFAITHAGSLTVNGTTTLGDATADAISFNGYVATSIIPTTDNAGDLGSTTNRWKTLHVGPGSVVVHNDATNTAKATLGFSGATAQLVTDSTTPLQFTTGSNVGLNINTSGNVGIGTSSPNVRLGQKLDIATSANYGGAVLSTWSATAAQASVLDFSRSKSATIGTQAVIANGDALGAISFRGSDGSGFVDAAGIQAFVDGTPGTNDMPGRLVFFTSPDGTTNLTERMRIDNAGNVGIGTATPGARLHVATGDFLMDNNFTFKQKDSGGTARRAISLSDTNNFYVGDTAGLSSTQIYGGGSTGITVLSTGNVGIGTTTAGSLLTVGSTGQFTVSSSGVVSTSGTISSTSVGTNALSGILTVAGNATLGDASTDLVNLTGMAQLTGFANSELGGTNGQMYYNSTLNKFRCYQNSAWTDCVTAAGGTMSSFTLAGSSGSNQTITDGNTLTIAQGNGIATVGGATDTVTVSLGNLTGAWNQTGNFAITHAGNLTVNGNTTLGDVSTDSLTFNAGSLSVPNNLNIDANTLFVDAANNWVGIGTATPGARLEVLSAGGANSGINLKLSSASSYVPIDFNSPSGLSGQFVLSGASFSSGAFGGDELVLASELTSGTLHLASIGSSGIVKFTTGGNTTGNERMRITSAGNVGIGTTTAGSLLTVGSTGQFTVGSTGNVATTGNATLGDTTTDTVAASGTVTVGVAVQTPIVQNTPAASTDVVVKIGTTMIDASVDATAKLLSIREGLGSTETEKGYFLKDGTYIAGGIGFGTYVYQRAGGFLYDSGAANLGMFNQGGSAFFGINLGTGIASSTGTFRAGGTLQWSGTTTGGLSDNGSTQSSLVAPTSRAMAIVSPLGAATTDVAVKAGTSVADASVNSGAKLFSIRTGIGGTEAEKAYFSANGGLNSLVVSGSNAFSLGDGARLSFSTTDASSYLYRSAANTIRTPGSLTVDGTLTGSNLSGTNTGDVTLGAVGSSPNANGASLSGQVLTLQPADATNPGVLTTGTQSIAGGKTFINSTTFNAAASISFLGSTPDAAGIISSTQTGGNLFFASNIGSAAASATAAAFHFKHQNGALDAADLEILLEDSAGNDLFKVTEAGNATLQGSVSSLAASGANAFSLGDGARLSFSTTDASSYLYRSAANVIRTPGALTVDGNATLGDASTDLVNLTGMAQLTGFANSEAGGTNGQMYYNSTLNKFRCYQNSAWTDCISTGGTMSSWTLAGTSGSNSTITNGNTATIAAGTNISTTGNGSGTVTVGLTGTVAATNGGTGQSSYATGDVLYASSPTALSKLAVGSNGQMMMVGSGLPSWSTATWPATTTANQLLYSSATNTVAGLATGNNGVLVTGATGIPSISTDLPTAVTIGAAYVYRAGGTDVAVADGGTGLSSGTSGGVLGFTASGTLASSVALTANALVLGGGAGATPTPLGSLGTATTVLHGNAAGAPTWATINASTDIASGTLPVARGGTGTSTAFTTGSVVFAGASGTYTQDNTNFFFDDTNNRLGIDTATPRAPVDILSTAGAQLRLSYADNTTYASLTADVAGNLTITPTGTKVTVASALLLGSDILGSSGGTTVLTTSGANVTAAGNLTVTGALIANGNSTLGDASTDLVNVTGMAQLTGFANSELGGTNGQMYYNSTNNKFRCRQNSAWTDCITAAGGTMSSFTLAGSSGSNQTITDGNTLTIAQGSGIATVGGATDTVTVSLGNLTGAWTQTGNFAITHAGSLTVNGTTTLGDATADAISFNGYIATNIIPTADNTGDLGSATNRWKTLHVGPGSVVVHNDATNTAKATLGFSGATAQLLTDAATPFQLTTGANIGLNINTSGNVGIGTATPAAGVVLDVNGAVKASTFTNMASPTVTANLIIEPATGTGVYLFPQTNNTSTFIIQNSGGSTVLDADTTNLRVGILTATPSATFSVGATSQFQVNSSGAIAAATGITSSGTITFSGFTSNGGALYTNASGVVAQATAGTTTQVLHGGTTPSFSAVSLTADVTGTLGVGSGGTGTGTTFTQGSVVFAGASGVYSQDNASLFWDNTNKRLGIGTATPITQFNVPLKLPSSTLATFTAASNTIDIDTQGRYAYVISSGTANFKIFDWSVPSSPTQTATVTPSAAPYGIKVRGNYAYIVTTANRTLNVYDVTNPTAPTLAGAASTDIQPQALDVVGRYAFVAASNDLQIFDVTNSASPAAISDTAISGCTLPYSVAVQGDYAYVACLSTNNVKILDISNPYAPTTVGAVAVGTSPYTVKVQGRYAYVVSQSSANLKVIDVADPATPTVVGTVSTGTSPWGLDVQGRYAYVTNYNSTNLQVFDVSTPSSPTSVGTVSTTGGPAGVRVQGRYAFVCNWGAANTVSIYDMGGAYIDRMEAGAIETGTIAVRGSVEAEQANLRGGLTVGQTMTINGDGSVSGNMAIGDSTADHLVVNASIGSSLLPSTDNTYDLGSATNRWKTLHVGPGSVVVHNDATNTAKATLGFSGATAQLVTNSATALQMTTGANVGLNMDTSGNVGIGTASPAGLLHVNASGYGLIQLGANSALGFTVTNETSDNSFNIWSGTVGSGTKRFSIQSDWDTILVPNGGNVGIGTSTPAALLSVGTTSQFQVNSSGEARGTGFLSTVDGSGSQVAIGWSSDLNTGFVHNGADDFSLYTAGVNRLEVGPTGYVNIDSGTFYVDAANNMVGVGTTSPQSELESLGASSVINSDYSTTTFSGGGKMYPGAYYYSTKLGGGGSYVDSYGGLAGGVFRGGASTVNYAGGGAGIVGIGGNNGSTYGSAGSGVYGRAGTGTYSGADGIVAGGYFDGAANTYGNAYGVAGVNAAIGVYGSGSTFGVYSAGQLKAVAGSDTWSGNFFGTSSSNQVRMGTYGGVATIGANNNAGSGWADLEIQPSGNVGIGTGTPGYKLDVVGDIRGTGNLYISTGNTTGNGIKLADDGDIVDLNDGFATHRFSYGLRLTNANAGGSTVIQLSNSASYPTYFNSSNNVGIGSTSPAVKLDVTGSIAASDLINGDKINFSMVEKYGDAAANNYKIATLPASASGTFDHLAVELASGGWLGSEKHLIKAFFGNRNGFTYSWSMKGSLPNACGTLRAYNNSGVTEIYVYYPASTWCGGGTVSVTLPRQATVITSPTDVGGSPTGTLIFDTSSPGTYPPTINEHSSSGGNNVGIGTVNSADYAKLYVYGTGSGLNVGVQADNTTAGGTAFLGQSVGTSGSKYGSQMYATGAGTNYALWGSASGGTTNYGLYVSSGQAYFADLSGTGTTNYQCATSTTSGRLGYCTSSIKYKEDVQPLVVDEDAIYRMRPVDFKWKGRDERGSGFIAEEVEQVIPRLATYADDGSIIGVNYPIVSVYLVDAIQRLNAKVLKLDMAGGSTYLITATSDATALEPAKDSKSLAFRGSAWDSGTNATVDVALSFTNAVTDKDNYRLALKNQLGAEVSYLGSNGDVALSGRLFPSDRGVMQTNKYIWYDGSAGPGGDMMRTNAAGWSTGSYDFAEMFPSGDALTPGDLVMIDGLTDESVRMADNANPANSYLLAGIVSTRPGFLAGMNDAGHYPVAMSGRVPTKVSLENGDIHIGDPITVSSVPGVGMKANPNSYVVGIALEPYVAGNDPKQIVVFLKPGWYNGADVAAPTTLVAGTTLNVTGPVDFAGQSLINVGGITGLNNSWSIDANGNLIAKSVTATDIEAAKMTVKLDDGTQMAGNGIVSVGNSTVTIKNPAIKANSRIFVTFYGNTEGSWWISRKTDGEFDISLSKVAATDLGFDYWLMDVLDNRTVIPAPVPPVTGTATTDTTGGTAPTVTATTDTTAPADTTAATTDSTTTTTTTTTTATTDTTTAPAATTDTLTTPVP